MWNVHKTVQTDHFSDAGRVFFTDFQVTPARQFEGFRDKLCFFVVLEQLEWKTSAPPIIIFANLHFYRFWFNLQLQARKCLQTAT